MKYQGSKSLDAEIYIDVVEGIVRMDYSSNSSHDPYNSNTSPVTDKTNEWFNLPRWKKFLLSGLYGTRFLYDIVVAIEMSISATLMQYKLFPASFMYSYQSFLHWYWETFHGIYEETFEGEMNGTVLQVPVYQNIWVNYELSEDYETFITNIDFERRIRKFRKFNMYNLFVQDGWMLTFTFSQPPKSGSVKVEYV